jgi:hypothetical protein
MKITLQETAYQLSLIEKMASEMKAIRRAAAVQKCTQTRKSPNSCDDKIRNPNNMRGFFSLVGYDSDTVLGVKKNGRFVGYNAHNVSKSDDTASAACHFWF